MEYLMAVVEERSFTRAAQRLGITQPALSHQVRALEREVGQPLLERLPSTVRLTPMGRAYVPHAATALRAVAEGRRAAGPGVEEPVRLEVATLFSLAQGVLPPAIRAWRRRFPDAEIHLREFANMEELGAYMALGVADLGVAQVPPRWAGPVHQLGSEDLVIVLAADDPLAADDGPLDLRLLADRSWVLYTADNMLAPVLERACAEAGFTPRAATRTRHTAAAARLAASGLGPTLVPRSIVDADLEVAVRRVDPPLSREIAAFSPAGTGEEVAAFVEALDRYGAPRLRGRARTPG
jgi:DNA-binding transcriptional LysR family regulator